MQGGKRRIVGWSWSVENGDELSIVKELAAGLILWRWTKGSYRSPKAFFETHFD